MKQQGSFDCIKNMHGNMQREFKGVLQNWHSSVGVFRIFDFHNSIPFQIVWIIDYRRQILRPKFTKIRTAEKVCEQNLKNVTSFE